MSTGGGDPSHACRRRFFQMSRQLHAPRQSWSQTYVKSRLAQLERHPRHLLNIRRSVTSTTSPRSSESTREVPQFWAMAHRSRHFSGTQAPIRQDHRCQYGQRPSPGYRSNGCKFGFNTPNGHGTQRACANSRIPTNLHDTLPQENRPR